MEKQTETCKEIIEKRRSVRSFKAGEISRETLLDIIDAARLAPSAKNRQPWRFVVLSKEQKKQVAEIASRRLKENNTEPTGNATIKILNESDTVILVFVDYMEDGEFNRGMVPNILSIGASIENALLRATELGIGSLWVYDLVMIKSELEEMFSPKQMFISAICLGQEDKKLPRATKKTLKDIVTIN